MIFCVIMNWWKMSKFIKIKTPWYDGEPALINVDRISAVTKSDKEINDKKSSSLIMVDGGGSKDKYYCLYTVDEVENLIKQAQGDPFKNGTPAKTRRFEKIS